jgi:hypothetical protein
MRQPRGKRGRRESPIDQGGAIVSKTPPLPGPRLVESSSAYDAVLVHMKLVELTVAVL